MSRRKRILISLAVVGIVASGLWFAPLQRPRALIADASPMFGVWFSPDSRFVAGKDYLGENPGRVRIWQVADGRPVATLERDRENIFYLVISPDGQEAAGVTDQGIIVLWDATNGRERRRIESKIDANKDALPLIRFNAAGELLIQDVKALKQNSPKLRMLHANTGQEVLAAPLHGLNRRSWPLVPRDSPPDRICFAEEEEQGVRWRLFDPVTGEPQSDWAIATDRCWMVFSSDGKTTVLQQRFGQTRITRFAVATFPTAEWTPLPALHDGDNPSLSRDGEWLSAHTQGQDWQNAWYARWLPAFRGRIRVIHVPSGEVAATFYGGDTSMFSPDGRTLAVFGNEEHRLSLWDFPPRRAWELIIGLPAGAGITVYLWMAWRARRRVAVEAKKPIA